MPDTTVALLPTRIGPGLDDDSDGWVSPAEATAHGHLLYSDHTGPGPAVDTVQFIKDLTGIQDIQDCASGSASGCVWIAVGLIPYGGKAGTLGKAVARIGKTSSRFGDLTHASSGIAPFRTQSKLTAGHGGSIQAHHLIERRFARQMDQNILDMQSIVLTKAEHDVFTAAWREAIPRGRGTTDATRSQIEAAARQIYSDYPEILDALGLG